MPYLGSWKIDDLLTFPAITHDFATGALTDADAVPAYRVYEDETGTAILTGNMAKLDDANTTGFYSEQLTLSAANGFEKGKCYSLYISAAVDSVTGGQTHTFQIEAEVDSNSVSNIGAGVITATAIATGAIDADAIADNAIDAGAIAADAITAAKIADGAIDANTFAAGAITATAIAADAIGASELAADAASEIGTAVWATATRALTILDEDSTTLDLDATIRAAVGLASANLDTQLDALPTNAELATALGTADDAVLAAIAALNNPSAASIADAVWDEDATAHQTQGTFGQAIGDPAADTNTIFKATVTDATGATVGVDAAAILADTGTDGVVVNAAGLATDAVTEIATGVWATATRTLSALDEDTTTLDLDATIRAAVGMASANLDTQLDALPTAAENAAASLTTQMTEAYAGDGVSPTLAQAIFLIMQHLGERSISSTTLTVKKLDGSTSAATFTLDSATTPTSITRSG